MAWLSRQSIITEVTRGIVIASKLPSDDDRRVQEPQ
jgi:hypothetical protein